MFLGVIGRGIDDFRCCLAGDSVVELVLHHSVKVLSYR